ncbi:MAG: colanic acid biosynthesis glycosyltransferase WcaI [Dehalococcoidia bacterium]|nr:MAG: colanic acid biosynthesis glycosyltransferase WcaI [Dehalococcoidia bacterium]
MTRILIAGINYAPEATGIAPYTTKVAEHLARLGYQVTAITGMPHYPAWRIDRRYAGAFALRDYRDGVELHRRWHYVPARQSAWRRGLYEASFFASGLTALQMPRPHAVLGVVPSLSGGLLARAAAQRFGAPYGLVFQDLMGRAAEQSGMAGAKVAGVARLAEGWAARGAAAVGIVAEGFRPYVEELGVEATRIRRVRNWTHTGEATVDREAMREWLGLPQEAMVCLHAGNMGQKQGLENVIACARLAAKDAPHIVFAFVGDGNQRASLEALAARQQLANVRFLPLQPEQLFPSVLAAADVLLINQRGSVGDMSLPSKLTSYFAAGRPVIAAAARGSETAREVMWSSGGLVVQPDDPAALLEALLRIENDGGLRAHLVESARTWAADVLSEEAALRSYEQLVAAVLASAPSGRVHTQARRQRAAVGRSETQATERRDRWAA